MKHYFYLYEVRNNISGKIYVGVHKTRNLNAGYMGSGKVIQRSIEKNGIENFTKTILEHFDSSEEMYAREKEVVHEEFLNRDDTYNLRRGGYGGFDYINKTGKNVDLTEQRKRDPSILHRSLATQKAKRIGFYNPEVSAKGRKKCLDLKLGYMNPEVGTRGRVAAQSESARIKRVSTMAENEHQRGEKNSQYGSRWITNGIESRKVSKSDSLPEGWIPGRKVL